MLKEDSFCKTDVPIRSVNIQSPRTPPLILNFKEFSKTSIQIDISITFKTKNWGLGFGVWGLGFGVWGLGDRKSVV